MLSKLQNKALERHQSISKEDFYKKFSAWSVSDLEVKNFFFGKNI